MNHQVWSLTPSLSPHTPPTAPSGPPQSLLALSRARAFARSARGVVSSLFSTAALFAHTQRSTSFFGANSLTALTWLEQKQKTSYMYSKVLIRQEGAFPFGAAAVQRGKGAWNKK
jgi:hypothetical protein